MAQTVAQCLTAAIDSVNVINDINTNGTDSDYVEEGATQTEINDMVQRNVDHLEIVLLYDGTNDKPNVVGSSSSKKTDCTNGITTGKAYIAAN